MKILYKDTYTYKFYKLVAEQVAEFVSTLGQIVILGGEFLKGFKNSV